MRCHYLLAATMAWTAQAVSHAPCPPDAVLNGLPFVQCNTQPPCIRWNWATVERCAQRRLDHEWPTYDPYVHRNHSWASMRELLFQHVRDKTLTLVGDSINNLWFHAFVCEAARHGLSVSSQAHSQAVSSIVHIAESNSTIVQMGWGKPTEEDTALMLAVSDVLVVNHGLHYHNETEYAVDMGLFFEKLAKFNQQPGKVAVFRETSAQAFDKTGSWTPGADKTPRCAETPLEVAYDNLVWRQNQLLWRLAQNHHVPILPFYNTTLPRWNMREELFCQFEGRINNPDSVCCDCTSCPFACYSLILSFFVQVLIYVLHQRSGLRKSMHCMIL